MIISKDNKLIKNVKALEQKKYRDSQQEYVIEGMKLLKEAIENGEIISKILICEELLLETSNGKAQLEELLKENKIAQEIEFVAKPIFEYLSDTVTPQGVLAVIKEKEQNEKEYSNIIFALDNLQDPGNLGTIIRTLDAGGYQDLILSNDSADPYNPKVVRSTMGAIFRLRLHRNVVLKEELMKLHAQGYKIVVTALDTNQYYYHLNFDEKLVIIIGNEAKGVKKEIQELADSKIKIPMIGKTESLNAAVATSIVAYEGVRQKFCKGI